MARRQTGSGIGPADVLATIAGTTLGLALGFVMGSTVGRVNSRRIKGAVARWRDRPGAGLWTAEAAERLETRVLDALKQDVVLARRAIRVAVLGMGLVELTGRVLHTSEVALAGTIAQRVPGVTTVLNHLVVGTPVGRSVPPADPGAARAARG